MCHILIIHRSDQYSQTARETVVIEIPQVRTIRILGVLL